MTTYAITAVQNVTALAAKAGGDTYNINGGSLVIDCDSRYGLNQGTTTGALGTITISSTLGGSVAIDGTKVRLIPFNSGTGTVPAAGTAITQGSVTSELLGVWSAINTTPAAAGAAMPASGFVKVRNVSGGAGVYAAGALTGIGATARSADIVGWIEVIGVAGKLYTIPALGSVVAQGAWMSPYDSTGAEVKTTGVAGQSIQLPASVANTYYAGCYVETAAGSGVYSRWPNAADMVNASLPTDERGRYCWISAAGVLVFGSDGTNTVGLLPPANCRIRVPNVLLGNTNATVGLDANAVPTNAVSTRFANEQNTSAGTISMDRVSHAWALQNASNGLYSISLTNSLISGTQSIQNPELSVTFAGNIAAQINSAAGDATALITITSYSGADIEDNTFFMQTNLAAAHTNVFSGYGFTFNRNRFQVGQVPVSTNGSGVWGATINGGSADSNEFIGHSLGFITLTNFTMTNSSFCAWAYGTALTFPAQPIFTQLSANNVTIDGFNWLLTTPNTCHPRGQSGGFGGASLNSGVTSLRVRNFGTPGAPLSLGTVNPVQASFLGPAFQVSLKSVKYQRLFLKDGSASPCIGSYRGNLETDIENCIVPGGALALSSPTSFARAIRTVTAPNAAAGACGVHWVDWFSSDTAGQILVCVTQPVATSGTLCAQTGGAPKWTGAPGLQLNSVGDQVTWIMNYFAQGHQAVTGVTLSGAVTAAKYLVEFCADLNDGNGMSAWATATSGALAALSINAALGVKLGLRATCVTANTETITKIALATTTTLAAQQAVSYPLDPVTISVTNIATGSRIKVTRTDNGSILDNAAVSGTSYSLTGDYTGVPVQVEVRCATPPGPYYQPWVGSGTVLSTGLALQALQVRDDQ